MDSVMELIKRRRSVRKYKQEQLKDDELALILEAARFAPSGHNSQTAHYVAVQSPEALNALRTVVKEEFAKMDMPEDSHHMMSASIRLSKKGTYNFMYNPPTLVIAANRRGYGNAMADCALGMGNMMLTAAELGVGSCWINQLRWLCDNPAVMAALEKLGVGKDEVVCGSLALGYSDQPNLAVVQIKGNRADIVK